MSNLDNLIREKNIKALIIDMDGVITKTAGLNAEAWKKMCDAYLRQRGEQDGKKYEPFDYTEDYRKFVHAQPRIDAVRNFFKSRGITLPEGSPDEDTGETTVHKLAKIKDIYFHELLKQDGVVLFEDTIEWIKEQQRRGVHTAIVSSSKNCSEILRRAGLDKLCEERVDGLVSAHLKLNPKPAPDIFLEAARRLNVQPEETAVIEDGASGIEAAKAANFALVVGVERGSKPSVLKESGADLVIKSFAPVSTVENA